MSSFKELRMHLEAKALMALPPMRFVFIDTETTGLARHWVEPEGRVIEFCGLPVNVAFDRVDQFGYAIPSVIRLDDQKVHFKLKITDEDLKTIDPESLVVNGYYKDTRPFHGTTSTDRSTPDGKHTRELWLQAAKAMSGRIVCSQNVMFDLQFVEKELRLYGLNDQIRCWERKFFELWPLSALASMANISPTNKDLVESWRRNSIPSLGPAVACLGLGNDAMVAHTADGDVEMGFQLFEYFLSSMVGESFIDRFALPELPEDHD